MKSAVKPIPQIASQCYDAGFARSLDAAICEQSGNEGTAQRAAEVRTAFGPVNAGEGDGKAAFGNGDGNPSLGECSFPFSGRDVVGSATVRCRTKRLHPAATEQFVHQLHTSHASKVAVTGTGAAERGIPTHLTLRLWACGPDREKCLGGHALNSVSKG